MPGRILVLGGAGVGKRRLVQAILGLESSPDKQLDELPDVKWTDSGENESFLDFVLSTKYYSAPLRFHVVHGDWSLSSVEISDLIADSEAIMHVVDQNSPVRLVGAQLADLGRVLGGIDGGPELRLLVWNGVPGKKEEEDEEVGGGDVEESLPGSKKELEVYVQEHCLNHFFEFVECDVSKPWDAGKGAEERNLNGVPRIREAMQATMWSNLEMKPRSFPTPVYEEEESMAATGGGAKELLSDGDALLSDGDALLSGGDALLSGGDALLSGGDVLLSDGDTATKKHATAKKLTTAETHSDEVPQNTMEEYLESLAKVEEPVLDADDEPAGMATRGDFEDQIRKAEALMAQVRSIRDNTANLDEHARREAAATVALQLAALMGGDDEDEEDDEEEEAQKDDDDEVQ